MAKHKKRKLQGNLHKPSKSASKPDSLKSSSKPKVARAAHKSQPTIPFQPEDRILLVGEGDFSFAKSIVEEHGCCDITATSYDSKEVLYQKYDPQAKEHVSYLEEEGQTVLCGVDATKLEKNKNLTKSGELFDVILFNFPHVGGKSTDVNRQVRFNQELLVNFFKAAINLLAASGTIVVTLFEAEPYTLWNIRDLARHSGLEVQRSFKFLADAYPGYSHARTLGNIEGGGGWKGEDREARSYVFQKKGEKGAIKTGHVNAKRKRQEMDSDNEDDR
ncbi:25S rRNA (uridine-N(3))-methyltransferase [Pseudocercospora fuligena]|uniref:25S rRNA (Uridine-N(3))-methyltransferase n=1 Tax=Pseudocercospora fuligena TaxID=685502 RepID=A0A8H6RBV7_9PEZI|nr:25S rRNA (uridine-N(3))-methyltransferase [Pseudocercospora fuligena]